MKIKKIMGWFTIILFPIILAVIIFLLYGKNWYTGVVVGVVMDISIVLIFLLSHFIRWCFDL